MRVTRACDSSQCLAKPKNRAMTAAKALLYRSRALCDRKRSFNWLMKKIRS